VYRGIRYYQQQEDVIQEFLLRLEPGKKNHGKRKDMSRLLKNRGLVRELDKLLLFGGLGFGLQLGNIRNLVGLHFPEPILGGLKHIYEKWNRITLGSAAIQRAVTIDTARKLQRRAPSASITDRQYIISEMDNKALFLTITDANLRATIKETLLGLEFIIPTFETFHDNVIYLAMGAKIISTLLIGEEKLSTTLLHDERVPTIYETMRSHWSAPEFILEEFREMEFREVTLERPDTAFHFFFMQIFIAALRLAPFLGHFPPKRETKRKRGSGGAISASMNPAYKSQFCERAQKFGFKTDAIDQEMRGAEVSVVAVPEPFIEDIHGEKIERRSGRPYMNAYKQLRSQLFLTNLRHFRAESGLNPSIMFVQRDFINAFFSHIRDGLPAIPPFETAAPRESGASLALARLPEQHAEGFMNRHRHESIESVQSEYTLARSTGPLSSVEFPMEIERHWSQFSLPVLGESDSAEQSLSIASMSDHSFPAPTLEGSPIGLQDDNSDGRSFPELGVMHGESVDNLSAASTLTLGPRSFPDFRNGDIGSDHRSASTVTDSHRTEILSPSTNHSQSLEYPESELSGGHRSFPAPEVQSIPSEDVGERRSFPQAVRLFEFTEYNGMTTRRKTTPDMGNYLTERDDWVMMVLKQKNIPKTIRSDRIVEHMMDEEMGPRNYVLIKKDCAEGFRQKKLSK
jgi:hypothetical protein